MVDVIYSILSIMVEVSKMSVNEPWRMDPLFPSLDIWQGAEQFVASQLPQNITGESKALGFGKIDTL